MDFIIQYNLLNNDQLLKVKDAVQDLPHQFVGLIPFSHEITSNEPITGTNHIPYGSTSFVETTHELKWKGLSFDKEQFNCETWTAKRTDMLNNGMTLPAVLMILYLQQLTDKDATIFMRPAYDLKQFSGHVTTVKEAIEFLLKAIDIESSVTNRLKSDSLVTLSQPKNIVAEWRWFIIGGEVIDGSMYRSHGRPHKVHIPTLDTYKIKAQDMANEWLPANCCVMDTCLLDSGELKIIEFNCINGSGFYDHAIKKVMTAWYKYNNGG